ncbi:O-antigen ligase family protein, partial [Lysinibacillus sp. D4A1_S13]|uniref:O-antigen ligase family protein n=1 Tax=Lysinibacillus sp. D4A1_S13 TaxID=2941228 RepID=UPI0020BF79BA
LMYLLALLYFGIKIFIRLITNFKKLFSIKHMLLASKLVLSLGIGFMSGHVLTAPAASIFFVVILAYLI